MSYWVDVRDKLPESGKNVLVFDGKFIMRAYYAAQFKIEQNDGDSDWFEYDGKTDNYWLPSGWYESNHCEETHWHITDRPITHWMPLPQPPK